MEVTSNGYIRLQFHRAKSLRVDSGAGSTVLKYSIALHRHKRLRWKIVSHAYFATIENNSVIYINGKVITKPLFCTINIC